jgi:hypothetical protein
MSSGQNIILEKFKDAIRKEITQALKTEANKKIISASLKKISDIQ